MNILVTGANGFIGRELCRVALANGDYVRAAVRSVNNELSSSEATDSIVIGDLGQDTDWSKALHGIDSVVHLASRVHVMHKKSGGALDIFRKVNVAATRKLAQQAAAAGVRRLVYISSVKVNGEEVPLPYTEQDKPSPRDEYAISKWEAEIEIQQIAAKTGLEVVIIRPPIVYGPEVKANFLQLMKIVSYGIPLPFKGSDNRRSLIFVRNLVDAIIACVKSPQAIGKTYLVSDGHDVSIETLVRELARALGRPSRLFRFPEPILRLAGKLIGKGASLDRLLGSLTIDMTHIRHDLHWGPPYSLEQGLKITADWFKDNYQSRIMQRMRFYRNE
jgi:UDP-glucose 4-epimerase